jgi:hypothetical protein
MANIMLRGFAMIDVPRSLIEFQHGFPDERACAAYLADARWPDGFRCPSCGHDKGWQLSSKAFTRECAACGKQTSVTAGTVMHGSKLPLTVWFWAAYLMATHSNGIAALQLQKQLGLGSYKSAWLLAAKLRQAMVAPHRSPLTGLVEIDETVIPHRTKADPPAGGQGRSADGKMLIAGAVEVHDGGPGGAGADVDFSRRPVRLHQANVAAGATAKTDGWSGYPARRRRRPVIGPMAAHVVLPWIHRVFSNLKTWALGVYHGLRKKHLQAYLDEFVFRFNRRRTRHAAFRSLLGIGVALKHVTYNMLIQPEAPT